jgi:signal recognition particle subunit SRP54
MFEALTEKLSATLSRVRGQTRLSEENIASAVRDVRLALLEADVNIRVVREFLASVQQRALGEEVGGGLSAGQHFIKIVHEELTALLGSEHQRLSLQGNPPVPIMLVGLQGSGKTSSVGKLARMLKEEGKVPYLIPADVYRPAAIDQLSMLARTLDVGVFPATVEMGALTIVKDGVKAARKAGADVVLIDTAGRLAVDEPLMQELEQIRKAVNPEEILFVADGMTGQDAVNTAQAFHERLALTGHILTKMDGDARGGAALSIRAITQQPIKFMTVGEKLENLERFHPERIASRILGMGDLLSLIEKAQETFDEQQALELQRKMSRNEFTLEDFLQQLRMLRSMGPMQNLLEMMPGMSGAMKGAVDEKQFTRIEAIICSMTPEERINHNIISMSRQKRIARGSGTRPNDVNKMLKQFGQMRKMMKKMSRMRNPQQLMQQMAQGGGGGLPPGLMK